MRRSREAAAETRRQAVRAASRLFRARGFDAVGLKDVMKAIGMTHGGFYRHFASKAVLAAEAVQAASDDSLGGRRADGDAAARRAAVRATVDAYLSPAHVAHPEAGCPLAALGGDAARQPRRTRAAFTSAVEAAVGALERALPAGAARRTRAIRALASMVGGVVLARAVADRALSDEILTAVRGGLIAGPP